MKLQNHLGTTGHGYRNADVMKETVVYIWGRSIFSITFTAEKFGVLWCLFAFGCCIISRGCCLVYFTFVKYWNGLALKI
jgi:hypothetical protein